MAASLTVCVDVNYRQANSIGSTANVAASPTCVQDPPPHSASDEHDSAHTFAGTLALSIHQFCTQPFPGQSAAAEHGSPSGRATHEQMASAIAISVLMKQSVYADRAAGKPERAFSGC